MDLRGLRDPEGMFKDEWNPTPWEIRQWGHSNAYSPVEDWELALYPYASLLIELVDDSLVHPWVRCFLLGALYVYVGDYYRTDRAPADWPAPSSLFGDAKGRALPLQRWADRARKLLAGEMPYTYEEWGLSGRLARDDCCWFDSSPPVAPRP